jgi:hypothetical protein
MPRKLAANRLDLWEVALVKALLARGGSPDQDILAYFTRPTRSINHRVIAEIRTNRKHLEVAAASVEELDAFLVCWPEVDPATGLSLRGDELLVKAREAMIAAVHSFNGAGLHFRAELFIVTAVIAWTYLLHAFFKREGIDYRFWKNGPAGREVEKTEHGADKYWELGKCLKSNECPLSKGEKDNLEFLLELRHEIEHRSTNRIDDAVSAKLQSCAINFNDLIKKHFGKQFGLERRLPIALQFMTFSPDQRAILKRAGDLPRHVETMMDAFHRRLSDEEVNDPRFAFRVALVPKTANRPKSADAAYELVSADSDAAAAINQILLKEVDRKKYRPGQIRGLMNREGFILFNMAHHTRLWQGHRARDPAKGYGTVVFGGDWAWYEKWVDEVRKHCTENAVLYGQRPVVGAPPRPPRMPPRAPILPPPPPLPPDVE